MPEVLRVNGIKFSFFSNEGNPREPIHIHAKRGRDEAKIWLRPGVSYADGRGFSAKEQAMLVRTVEDNRELIERAWNEFFG
jgi:Domain of unknown function (DUF4160)